MRVKTMRGSKNRTMLVGTIALVVGLVAPAGAYGSTVTVANGNTVRVLESGNEANRVSVSYDGGMDLYTVFDAAASLTPSGTCVAVDANTATCPGAGITRVSVDTGDRDDSIALDDTTVPQTITQILDGGPANDVVDGANAAGTLRGGSGNDLITGRGTLSGESGNDTLVGSPEADNLRGGNGSDGLDGGNGSDNLDGGGGTDAVLYHGRANPVNVTVGSGNDNDGGPEDQTGASRDTVRGNVEVVAGTVSNDVLIGDSSSETLIGAAGNDLIVGNRGGDTLLGLDGDDLISGGAGRDTLRGAAGNDRLLGGPDGDRLAGGQNDDFLRGKKGSDVMKGKSGVDRINAKDGVRDVRISCGPGPNGAEGAKRDRRLDPRARSC